MTEIANTAEYDAWNGESGRRWVADPDRRDGVLAPIGDVLVDAAHLAPGEHVLDVGCGCGATTLAAADAVGSGGAATGVDLSAPMLDVAWSRARTAGLDNVRFVLADAQVHPFDVASVDVVISRFGTMFFSDPAAAFANVARAMRRGGRLCIATWQPLVANEWLTAPGAALLRFGSIPETADDGPGMFAQADPAVISNTLSDAGFDDVDVRPVSVVQTVGTDVDEAIEYLAESGPGRAVLATVPEHDRPAAISAVREVLADHVSPNGVELGAAVWITTARRG